jgi:nucleotide-binding universal stress UspA family protein
MSRTALPWRHVLVTTDLSPAAEPAFEAAAELARRVGARVTVLNVIDLTGLGDSWALRDSLVRLEREYRTEVRPRLETLCASVFKDLSLMIDFVEGMGAADTICRHARENEADLIVIATHGHTGVKRFLVGSVAERVVQRAPCDVIVVRSDSEAKGD